MFNGHRHTTLQHDQSLSVDCGHMLARLLIMVNLIIHGDGGWYNYDTNYKYSSASDYTC